MPTLISSHLLGCRGQGWRTSVSFISKPTGVTNSRGSAFDLAVAHELNLMGNELRAKARELWSQERKARQTQKLVDPRSDDKVATH